MLTPARGAPERMHASAAAPPPNECPTAAVREASTAGSGSAGSWAVSRSATNAMSSAFTFTIRARSARSSAYGRLPGTASAPPVLASRTSRGGAPANTERGMTS